MDLMWAPGGLFIAGPDTTAHVSELPAGTEVTALRFRPGAAVCILGVPAVELLDARVPAADVWVRTARELTDRLEDSRNSAEAAQLLLAAVRSRVAAQPELDRAVQQVVEVVRRAGGEPLLQVAELAEQVGLSERQLHRRSTAALGYGPKTFARIIRFQRFVQSARNAPHRSLSELAAHSGYADQPHLNRESRLLAGVSPAALLAEPAR